MGANSSSPTNVRRAVLGVVGLAVGLAVILIGLNVLSGSDAPPPDTPRVQTGSLPTGTARAATPTTTIDTATNTVPPGTVVR